MACRIRGVKNPAYRKSTPLRNARPIAGIPAQYSDDGTRYVKIIGCEYRLSESEILNWLTIFGEVLSEITEEPFGDDEEKNPDMPQVGNGTYLVDFECPETCVMHCN